MARIDVTQAIVYERLVARLIEQLPELNERSCFETLYVESPALGVGGDFFVTVAPGGGSFDLTEGTGEVPANDQLMELDTVLVTAYSRIKLQQPGRDELLLRDLTRGLFVLKGRILKALFAHDLETAGDDAFLRELLRPVRSYKPEYDIKQGIGWLTMEFSISWDWDLA